MTGFDNALLAALAERQTMDMSSLSRSLPPTSFAIDVLLALAERLPTGLVHADAIYVLPSAPDGLLPLAPDSAWYASDRTLMVTLSPDSEALESLLADLGLYHQITQHVHERLVLEPELVDALERTERDPLAVARLAMILDATPERIGRLEDDAPGLSADLAHMARASFDPEVHVHAELLGSVQLERGRAIADVLLSRVPQGTFFLAVSDHTDAIELLSPYTRDLGHALYTWALENPHLVRTDGLVDAIRSSPDVPDDDLAALVVPDLLRHAPELLKERRHEEATQGLWLDDLHGTAHGFTHLEQLDAPDRALLELPHDGTIVVLAGGAPRVLKEATRVLIESARVGGFVGIFEAEIDGDRSVIADALVSDTDGVRLGTAATLVELAEKHEIPSVRAGAVPVSAQHGAPILAMNILQSIRRTRVLGTLEPDTAVYLVLHPTKGQGVIRAQSRLWAARLGFLALVTPKSQNETVRRKASKSEGIGRTTRRFRA